MSNIVIRPIEKIKKKCLAKGMGIEIDELSYIECTIDLKKEE